MNPDDSGVRPLDGDQPQSGLPPIQHDWAEPAPSAPQPTMPSGLTPQALQPDDSALSWNKESASVSGWAQQNASTTSWAQQNAPHPGWAQHNAPAPGGPDPAAPAVRWPDPTAVPPAADLPGIPQPVGGWPAPVPTAPTASGWAHPGHQVPPGWSFGGANPPPGQPWDSAAFGTASPGRVAPKGRGLLIAGLVVAVVLVLGLGGAFGVNAYAKGKVCNALAEDNPFQSEGVQTSAAITNDEIDQVAEEFRKYGNMLVFDGALETAVVAFADDLQHFANLRRSVAVNPSVIARAEMVSVAGAMSSHLRQSQQECGLPAAGLPTP